MKPPNAAPLYATIWVRASEVARENGYCLAIHGTMGRDLDLLAVPWTDEAASAEVLVERMADALAWAFDDGSRHVEGPTEKPHGRRAWAFPFMAEWAVDLSVMPRANAPTKESE